MINTLKTVSLPNVLDQTDQAIFILDNNKNIIFCNKKCELIFEKNKNKITEKNFISFIDDYISNHNFKKLIDDTLNWQPFDDLRIACTNKNKTQIELSCYSIPLVENKKITGAALYFTDITQVINLEKKERFTRDQLENIISHIPGFIFWKDTNFVLMGCNDNFAKLAGETTRSIVGKTDYELPWSLEQTKAFIEDDKKVIMSECPRLNIEEPMRIADGSEIMLLTNKVPLKDLNGKTIGVIGICTDITQRLQMEKAAFEAKDRAEAANLAKSNFLASISHELRTPLNAIIGLSELLLQENISEKVKESLKDVHGAGQHLLDLVNDILDFSKLEAAKIDLKMNRFNLKSLVTEVFNITQKDVTDRVKLTMNYDPDTPEWVVGDKLRIKQILFNLTINALKFTEKGKVSISVNLQERRSTDAIFQIIIEDTGIGISKDRFSDIFDMFTQVESEYNRRYKGAGLGLAICKNLVNLMNGKIAVESELGIGSKFIVTLPLITSSAVTTTTPIEDNPTLVTAPSFADKRILLVEDNLLNQKVVVCMLETLKLKIDVACNAFEAINLIKDNDYNLILMDIGLPDCDGITLTTQLRQPNSKVQAIPIIALTAHVTEEDMKNCLAGGVDDILTKPISINALIQTLERWL